MALARAAALRDDLCVAEPHVSDAELLSRVGAGDGRAFETLYRRYARPVFALALRRLGDRGRAEEAVQDAFASIWRSASTYSPSRGSGAAWLYAVARNAIVDRARGGLTPVGPLAEPPPAEPPERVEESWQAWRVHRAVDDLPPSERTVVELAYWQGLSQSQ